MLNHGFLRIYGFDLFCLPVIKRLLYFPFLSLCCFSFVRRSNLLSATSVALDITDSKQVVTENKKVLSMSPLCWGVSMVAPQLPHTDIKSPGGKNIPQNQPSVASVMWYRSEESLDTECKPLVCPAKQLDISIRLIYKRITARFGCPSAKKLATAADLRMLKSPHFLALMEMSRPSASSALCI